MSKNWSIGFFVKGVPVPQGSMRCFGNRVVPANAAKLKNWRKNVNLACKDAMRESKLKLERDENSAYVVTCKFTLLRPKSSKSIYANKRPDIDKLARAINDAITYVCFEDDCRVTHMELNKNYTNDESEVGVEVIVQRIN